MARRPPLGKTLPGFRGENNFKFGSSLFYWRAMQIAPEKSSPDSRWRTFLPWLGLLLAMAFVAVVRIRMLNVPLERDEGEFAYIGQLMLQGVPPYKLAYAMKLPGTCAMYALAMAVFGQSAAAIHLGLLLTNVTTIVFLFFIGRKLFDATAGVVAAAFYALISAFPEFNGMSAHATHFVVLFATPGIWVLIKAVESERRLLFFAGGLLFGLAFLMKQHGAVFTAFAVAYVAWIETRRPPLNLPRLSAQSGALLAGAAIPYAATCAALSWAGVFKNFWLWTVINSGHYVSAVSPARGWELFADFYSRFTLVTGMPWAFTAAAFLWIACVPRLPKKSLLLLLMLFSVVGASLGFYFRPHYFVLLMPAFALTAGAAVSSARQFSAQRRWPAVIRQAPLILFIALCGCEIAAQAGPFFRFTPRQLLRLEYGDDIFDATKQAGDYLRGHSPAGAEIAVLGSEPEIYFYARRRSATGIIYMYDLMAENAYATELQHRMIRDIEAARPEFGVLVVQRESWLTERKSDMTILAWCASFFSKYYRPVGVIDLVTPAESVSVWGERAPGYILRGASHIIIYRRRANAD